MTDMAQLTITDGLGGPETMRPTIPQTHGANGFRNDSRRREAVGVVTTGGDSCAARSDVRHERRH